MPIDLNDEEVVLLAQLVNQQIVTLQKQPNREEVDFGDGSRTTTPLEARLLRKLLDAQKIR